MRIVHALGVAGEIVFEFFDALVFIDLAHRGKLTGETGQRLFEEAARLLGPVAQVKRTESLPRDFYKQPTFKQREKR